MDLKSITFKLLEQAEELLGPRCTDWQIYEYILFKDGPPHLEYYPEERKIVICLSTYVRENDYYLLSQLSHEIAHAISPAVKIDLSKKILVINEGVSEYYSVIVLSCWLGYSIEDVYNAKREPYANYFKSLNAVLALIQYDDEIIKKLRIRKPYINELCFDDFYSINTSIDNKIIEYLLEEFT